MLASRLINNRTNGRRWHLPALARLETLDRAGDDELNAARMTSTWGGKELELVPAHVVMRTVAHLYHHQGQVTAMCRLLGKPIGFLDYPHGVAS